MAIGWAAWPARSTLIVGRSPMDVADIDLHVWPDPVTDQLVIQDLRPGTTAVLVDAMGRTVHTGQVVSSTVQVPIMGMPNG